MDKPPPITIKSEAELDIPVQQRGVLSCGICQATFTEHGDLYSHLESHANDIFNISDDEEEEGRKEGNGDDSGSSESRSSSVIFIDDDRPVIDVDLLDEKPSSPPPVAVPTPPPSLQTSTPRSLSPATSSVGQSSSLAQAWPSQCPECHRIFRAQINYSHHKFPDTINSSSCFACGLAIRFRCGVKAHAQRKHFRDGRFICPRCDQDFFSLIELMEHCRLHDEETRMELMSCSRCGKVFRNAESLNGHMKMHRRSEKLGVSMGERLGPIAGEKVGEMSKEIVQRAKSKNGCFLCGNARFGDRATFLDHMRTTHKTGSRYNCPKCSYSFSMIVPFRTHYGRKHGAACPYCTDVFATDEEAKEHQKNEHGRIPMKRAPGKPKVYQPKNTGKTYRCVFCEIKFVIMKEYLDHMAENHKTDGIYRCPDCSESFRLVEPLKTHWGRNHATFCTYCCRVYRTKELLDEHNASCKKQISIKKEKKKKASKRSYVPSNNPCEIRCPICMFLCKTRAEHLAHMSDHRNADGMYECRVCKEPLPRVEAYYVHVAKEHKGRVCRACNFINFSLDEFKAHVEEYHKDKFICDSCDASFYYKGLLIKHFKGGLCTRNEGGKDQIRNIYQRRIKEGHICPKCPPEKKFTSVAEFKKHLSSVHDARFCSACNEICDSLDAYLTHLDNHPESLRFTCEHCKVSYTNQAGYNYHIARCGKEEDAENPEGKPVQNKRVKCKVCKHVSPSRALHNQHYRTEHRRGSDRYYCSRCEFALPNYQALIDHFKRHLAIKAGEKETEPSPCKLCPMEFGSKIALRRHMLQSHPKMTVGSHRCYTCGMEYLTKSGLTTHKKRVHSAKATAMQRERHFDCKICGFKSNSLTLHQFHLRSMHKKDDKWQCNVCVFEEADWDRYMHHMRLHTSKTRAHMCLFCGVESPNLVSSRRHLEEAHKIDGEYSCDICSERLPTTERFIAHLKSHGARFCHICKTPSSSVAEHRRHMAERHGGDIFTCTVCDVKFRRAVGLRVHMKEHEAEALAAEVKVQCAICGAVSDTEALHQLHLRQKHRADDVFACTKCDYVADCQEKLAEHEKRHAKTKFYRCKLCGERSKMLSSQLAHINVEHRREDGLIHCHLCPDGAFQKYDDMVLHLRTHGARLCPRPDCEYVSTSSEDMDRHLLERHGEQKRSVAGYNNEATTFSASIRSYTCVVCQHYSASMTAHRAHINEKHRTTLDEYICPECEDIFWNWGNLVSHMQQHSTEELACDKCEFTTRNKDGLKRHHAVYHSGDTSSVNQVPRKCNFCEEVLPNLCLYRIHQQKAHKKGGLFVCPVCELTYATRYDALRHFRLHGNEDSLLGQEPMVTGNEEKLSCPKCSFTCRWERSLQRHMETVHAEDDEGGEEEKPGDGEQKKQEDGEQEKPGDGEQKDSKDDAACSSKEDSVGEPESKRAKVEEKVVETEVMKGDDDMDIDDTI